MLRVLPVSSAILLAAACSAPEPPASPPAPAAATPVLSAAATILPIGDVDIGGEVHFTSAGEFVRIEARIEGLDDGLYGFHIHEGSDCAERGGHYDPTGRPHGAPDEPDALRHVGDLGNLISRDGVARYHRIDPVVRLDGEHRVTGRIVVVHAGRDQYLPQPAGDSGAQIGCGPILPRVR